MTCGLRWSLRFIATKKKKKKRKRKNKMKTKSVFRHNLHGECLAVLRSITLDCADAVLPGVHTLPQCQRLIGDSKSAKCDWRRCKPIDMHMLHTASIFPAVLPLLWRKGFVIAFIKLFAYAEHTRQAFNQIPAKSRLLLHLIRPPPLLRLP